MKAWRNPEIDIDLGSSRQIYPLSILEICFEWRLIVRGNPGSIGI
jgi:hypothetical protein